MSYELNNKRKDATAYTRSVQNKRIETLNSEYKKIEEEDVQNYKNHLIYSLEGKEIKNKKGETVWRQKDLEVLSQERCPDTVNPYLWKNANELTVAGVVELADGVYAVINVESAAIIFIRSANGWIVQDCGGAKGGARAAVDLTESAIGENIHDNIKAVIYSHTHIDHIGGSGAILSADQVGLPEDGKIPVFGPEGFEQGLIDENLYAGVAMNRRIQYQCGFLLPHDEKGWVSNGVHVSFGIHDEGREIILPNVLIDHDCSREIDGIRVTFILTPDTETHSHMCTYYDDYGVLYLGDNGVGCIHNIYTMRGTPVRDANQWGKVFYHLSLLFGNRAQAVCPGHGLPCFKSEDRPDNIEKYLLDCAAAYKFTNDQALLMANQGYTMEEIGSLFEAPEPIARTWYTQGIYGNYAFNAKGVYQKYLGFYDGNPVNLDPLPKTGFAEKLVDYIGSEELVIEKAKDDFERGEYQWVATITNYIVYKNPGNTAARFLCADALEQLAYQEENSIRRNAYLSGAVELRNPEFAKSVNISPMDNNDVIPYVSVDLILDYLGINFDGKQGDSAEKSFILAVSQNEKPDEYHAVNIYHGCVLHEKISDAEEFASETVSATKHELYLLASGKYDGDNEILKWVSRYIVDTSGYSNFNLIEPKEW